ncbi:MAG: HU family DNA-binding protein [Thermoguttaceae bacterium]|nr:HU family DNA-binding protein [Thermoguttaceae bacterium]
MAKCKKSCAKKETAAAEAKPAKTACKAKAVKAAKCAPPAPTAKPFSKAQIVAELSEKAGLTKKDATAALDALLDVIKAGLTEAESFTVPNVVKIEKQWVEEKPAEKGVPDPFHKGETIDRPAKPAHWKVKVKILKGLKEVFGDE